MTRSPPAVTPYDHVRAYYDARLRAPGEAFRAHVAETLTEWRLGPSMQRVACPEVRTAIVEGLSEIAELRLLALCLPLFQGLQRIDNQMAIIARDPVDY